MEGELERRVGMRQDNGGMRAKSGILGDLIMEMAQDEYHEAWRLEVEGALVRHDFWSSKVELAFRKCSQPH